MKDFLGHERMQNLRSLITGILIILLFLPCGVQSAARAEDGFDFGSLIVNLRTQYFNRNKDQNNADAIAAVQGVRLDYASPFIGDRIGFGGSLFASLKLNGENGQGGTFLLRDRPNGDQSSYWKLGQAYVKVKLAENMALKAGRMVLGKPLLGDSDTRSTPSATQALLLEGSQSGTSYYAIASDRASNKTEGKFIPYKDNTGSEFNVYVVGAAHGFDNGLSAQVSYGIADNIVQKAYLNLSYDMELPGDMALQLDAHQYIGRAVGDGALADIGRDYGSALTNLAAALSYKTVTLTTSYQTVKGDTYQASWDNDHDETELETENSTYRLDYNRGGEDSIQVRLDWDLKDFLHNLKFMTRYTYGTGIRRADGREGREWTRDVDLKYEVPMVEGLSVLLRNSVVRSSETNGTNDNRVVLNYSRKVF